MQYNEKAFSKDGTGKTMEARDGQKLGQAAHMDANDVMKINQVYNCPVKKRCKFHFTCMVYDQEALRGGGGRGVLTKVSYGRASLEGCRVVLGSQKGINIKAN